MSQKVLITGASGGFGHLTVNSLLEKGHQVVGTMRDPNGRNQEVAKQLTAAGATVIEMDVTNEASVNNGVKQAIDALGGLDVVINNAGLGVFGMQEHFTTEDYKRLFDVNVFGVQRVNRAALPHLRSQGSGTIIYVSSLLGRITLPFYGPYNSSKWALEAMAENYRTELSGFGIDNVIVEPGGYPTTFMTNLMLPSDDSRSASYGSFMEAPMGMAEGFKQALENNPAQDPQNVANVIVNLVDTPVGQRPFRTTVDNMGMGDGVKSTNDQLDQVTQGVYGAFGIDGMLSVKTPAEMN